MAGRGAGRNVLKTQLKDFQDRVGAVEGRLDRVETTLEYSARRTAESELNIPAVLRIFGLALTIGKSLAIVLKTKRQKSLTKKSRPNCPNKWLKTRRRQKVKNSAGGCTLGSGPKLFYPPLPGMDFSGQGRWLSAGPAKGGAHKGGVRVYPTTH